MISSEDIIKLFEETGVLQKGHFELTSGRHAEKYLQCAQILQYPEHTNKLARAIAEMWVSKSPELVVGPAIGGIIISYAVGQALGIPSIFTERKDGVMALRRNFSIKPGTRVLIVEDVVTTGGSVMEVINLVEDRQARIIGISSLVDRSGGKVSFPYKFEPLLKLRVESYKKEECPLCKKGIAITKPGSREN